ncbi:hypothetical protein ACS0X5_14895 [Burkholderia gladioli]|uniref:hypothetical protein n=1 Tax=Burkholderia gladioli TaxID=28095 RepID=UPI003B987452
MDGSKPEQCECGVKFDAVTEYAPDATRIPMQSPRPAIQRIPPPEVSRSSWNAPNGRVGCPIRISGIHRLQAGTTVVPIPGCRTYRHRYISLYITKHLATPIYRIVPAARWPLFGLAAARGATGA